MTIYLSCSSICNPPCEITWYKDERPLSTSNPDIDIRRNRSVSGKYQCEASGEEGKVKSDPVQIFIHCTSLVIWHINVSLFLEFLIFGIKILHAK